jgi:hypothetical protein
VDGGAGAGASAGNNMDARGEVGEFIEASKGLCGRGDGNGVSKAMDSGDPNRGLCLSGLSSSGGLGDRNMSIFVRQFDDSSRVMLSCDEGECKRGRLVKKITRGLALIGIPMAQFQKVWVEFRASGK